MTLPWTRFRPDAVHFYNIISFNPPKLTNQLATPKMPATESEVGITETLGSHNPFRAVLKQRVEDFVVQEVLCDGRIAEITQLPRFTTPKRETKDDNCNKNPDPVASKDPTDEQYAELDAVFASASASASAAAEENDEEMEEKKPSDIIKAFISQERPLPKHSTTNLPACPDKTKRTIVHDWIKNYLPICLSNTVENGVIRLCPYSKYLASKRKRSDDSGREAPSGFQENGSRISRDSVIIDPVSGKEFDRNTPVQFILWKRDREQNNALDSVSAITHTHSSSFSYAGTKDKRGITMQLVQVRRVRNLDVFVKVNRAFAEGSSRRHVNWRVGKQFVRTIAVGNVTPIARDSKPINLGHLKGNRFTIALRDVEIRSDADRANVEEAAQSLRRRGFINYFGMQRFGSGVSPTHITGFALLRGDYKEVCRRLLLPLPVCERKRNDDSRHHRSGREKMVDALEQFAKREITAKKLLDCLPKRMMVERRIVESFKRDEFQGRGRKANDKDNEKEVPHDKQYDYRSAFGRLPRYLRMMYAHAVQSYLWNRMASARINYNPPNCDERMHAIAGDLILCSGDSSNVSRDSNGNSDNKESGCTIGNGDGGAKDESLDHLTKVRAVTELEEEERSVSVFRVVIPVVGTDVGLPSTVWGEVARKDLESHKVDLASFSKSSEFILKGTYRYLMAIPGDLELKLVPYSNPFEQLIPTGIEHLSFDDDGYSPRGKVDRRANEGKETGANDDVSNVKEEVKIDEGEGDGNKSGANGDDGNVKEEMKVDEGDGNKSRMKVEKGQSDTGKVQKKHDHQQPQEGPDASGKEDAGNGDTNGIKSEMVVETKEGDTNVKEEEQEQQQPHDEGSSEHGKAVENNGNAPPSSSTGKETEKDEHDDTDNGTVIAKNKSNATEERHAVVLSFTLGTAQYATMLVRELTKQDTTTAGQKAMQKEAE